jgi:hypothetical protein
MVSSWLGRLVSGGLWIGVIVAQLATLAIRPTDAATTAWTESFLCGESIYSYGMATYVDCPTANQLRFRTYNGPACLLAYRRSSKELIRAFYPRDFIRVAVNTSETEYLEPGTITITRVRPNDYVVEIEIPGIPANDIAISELRSNVNCY